MVLTHLADVTWNHFHHKLQLSTSWYVPCAMSCWLLEDWSYSSTCQVRNCLPLTAGNAMTQLLLTEVQQHFTGASLFPSKSSWLLYLQCREFLAFQKVIALSQVPLSPSTSLIHAAMAGGSTAHRADIQNSYSGQLRHSDPSSLRKENGHRQPLPTNHSCCLIWGACLCLSMTSNFCIRREMEKGGGRVPRNISQFHTEK